MYHDSIDIYESYYPKTSNLLGWSIIALLILYDIYIYIDISGPGVFSAFPPAKFRAAFPKDMTAKNRLVWMDSVGEIVGQCLGCFAPQFGYKENMKKTLPEIPTAGYLSSGKRVKKKISG